MWRLAKRLILSGGLIGSALAAAPVAADGLAAFTVRGDAVEAPLRGLAGDASRGARIVRDRRQGNCLICHAMPRAIPPDAEPFQGEIGPSLDGVGARLSAGQLRLRMIDQSLINPETIMPPFYRISDLHDVAPEYRGKPALNAQEVEDVVAYLATLKE